MDIIQYIILAGGIIFTILFWIGEYKKDKRETIHGFLFILTLGCVMIIISFGTLWLIDNRMESAIGLIIFCLIIWIVWLYFSKNDIKEKYKRLLHFSHKFYEKEKRMNADEDDCEDYTLYDFEEEFEDWLKEFEGWLREKENSEENIDK